MNLHENILLQQELEAYKQFVVSALLKGTVGAWEELGCVLEQHSYDESTLPMAKVIDGYTIRSKLRYLKQLRMEIHHNRQKSRADTKVSLRDKACDQVGREARTVFKENEGRHLDTSVSVYFRSQPMDGHWSYAPNTKRFESPFGEVLRKGFDTTAVMFHLHASWSRKVGYHNAFMTYAGKKTFVLDSNQIENHALENQDKVTVHTLSVFGERTESALSREIDVRERDYSQALRDGDNDYAIQMRDEMAEIRALINTPHNHQLYAVVSTEYQDDEGNQLRGVGTTVDSAYKLLQRRIRDSFVRELEI